MKKSYSDYISEINSKELLEGLIGHGLFAEKIPHFLTSKDFSVYTNELKLPLEEIKAKDNIRYASMRNINVPRQMAIPEPFAYANLCSFIAENWKRIQKYFEFESRHNKYKISRIHLRKMENTATLFEMNYKNYEKDGAPQDEILVKSRYIVEADISNFFPSVYSHSIPWVLKGKKFAKHHRDKNLWFNKLDYFIRNLKYGETNGLLIGPHVSNLISEIILIKIDSILNAKGYKYIRHIDDFTCYVPTYEIAEQFLIDLSEELRNYELKLNDKKSKIIPLPQASVKNWVTKLNNYIFINTYKKTGKKGSEQRN